MSLEEKAQVYIDIILISLGLGTHFFATIFAILIHLLLLDSILHDCIPLVQNYSMGEKNLHQRGRPSHG